MSTTYDPTIADRIAGALADLAAIAPGLAEHYAGRIDRLDGNLADDAHRLHADLVRCLRAARERAALEVA